MMWIKFKKKKPSRQAIEVRVEEFAKQLRIWNSFFVTTLYEAIIHVAPHIVVANTTKASRRWRALSNSFR